MASNRRIGGIKSTSNGVKHYKLYDSLSLLDTKYDSNDVTKTHKPLKVERMSVEAAAKKYVAEHYQHMVDFLRKM